METEGTTRGTHTELQSMLVESRNSAFAKYVALYVGRRGLGALLQYELACWILAPMPGALGLFLRSRLYSSMLRSSGKQVVFGRNVSIRHPRQISVASGAIIDDNSVLDAKGNSEDGISMGEQVVIGRNTILSCKGGSIDIGPHSNISANCMLISESKLSIGENVLVAGMTYIIAGGNHGTERTDIPMVQQPMVQKGGIRIEDNCWLGANVTVLDGVTIGRDSIVGAGAVVTESLPEFSISLGIPAKVVKMRK